MVADFVEVAAGEPIVIAKQEGKKPRVTADVARRFERPNPTTKENPTGAPKVFVLGANGVYYVQNGDGWSALHGVPAAIAHLVSE